MDNFFKLHDEKTIGYKVLTYADLGLSKSSSQTHIGLYNQVLSYLKNNSVLPGSAILIYKSCSENLDLYFDRIKSDDGSFRSPKIRMGEGKNTVTYRIRKLVEQSQSIDVRWYLFWFGLEGERFVFWLFNEKSKCCDDMENMGLELKKMIPGTSKPRKITSSKSNFWNVIKYIENIYKEKQIELSLDSFPKELEIDSQIKSTYSLKKNFSNYDIEMAQKLFSEIGRRGEEFVAEYFEKLKQKGEIQSYFWANKSSESGCPFDFSYKKANNQDIYLDVKTTTSDFENKIIYSNEEISFALSLKKEEHYKIFRVYQLSNNEAALRICDKWRNVFLSINQQIEQFQKSLLDIDSKLENIKLSLSPAYEHFSFTEEINLNR